MSNQVKVTRALQSRCALRSNLITFVENERIEAKVQHYRAKLHQCPVSRYKASESLHQIRDDLRELAADQKLDRQLLRAMNKLNSNGIEFI